MSDNTISDAEISAAVEAEGRRQVPAVEQAQPEASETPEPANNNDPEGRPEGEQPDLAQPKFQPWEERRIARFTRQMREMERGFQAEREAMQTEIARLQGQGGRGSRQRYRGPGRCGEDRGGDGQKGCGRSHRPD